MSKLPKWMRPANVKSSGASQVIMQGIRMPGPVGHLPFGQMAKASYERNITIYACVNEIALACSTVPWVLMKRGRAGKKFAQRIMTEGTARKSFMFNGQRKAIVRKALETTTIENHPALALLESPNPDQSAAEYIIQLVSYFLIAGNCYQEFITPITRKGAPMEMWNLRPDRVDILPNTHANRHANPDLAGAVDATAMILGYRYKADTNSRDFDPASILHKKFFHPTNDLYGFSPLQVAARSFMTDNLSADWNYALLKNQARPSGALVAPNAVNDDTYERIKMEIRDSYQGGENAGTPLFLEGGLDWKPLSLSPLEMDWLASREYNRVELCAVYRVPPEIIGDSSHKTYNSFPEARRAFWMEAVLPILDSLRDSYNQRLIPFYGEGYFLDYDRDQIDALVEEQKLLWDRVKTAGHLSTNEKRDATGYESYDGDSTVDPVQDVPSELLPKESMKITDPNVPENEGPTTLPVDPATPGKKAQQLNTVQKRAMKRLKVALAGHYKAEGKALAEHVRRELNKL